MVTHLARNFSTTVAPHLERNIGVVLASSIVPTVASSVSKAVDGVMLAVRQEMVDVRKEIVREQSDALESTEHEVHALRSDVRELKAALVRMEKLVGQLVSSPVAPITPARASPREPIAVVEPEPEYTLPAIPRPTTPKDDYEDLFTNALQPEHEPEFTSLLYLVNYAPPHRVDALFPARKQDSCITPAVILSLAFRLGQVFGSKTGKLDEDGRRQLGWLRKAINAMDDKVRPPSRVPVEKSLILGPAGRAHRRLHAPNHRVGHRVPHAAAQGARARAGRPRRRGHPRAPRLRSEQAQRLPRPVPPRVVQVIPHEQRPFPRSYRLCTHSQLTHPHPHYHTPNGLTTPAFTLRI